MKLQLAASMRFTTPAGVTDELALRDAALLAWLALEGPTSRARLAALLWPHGDLNAARNALRQRLFQLRRQVGAALVVGAGTLSLAAGVRHDLDESDSVLGDLTDHIGDEFATWLAQQRERRRHRLGQSLVELSDKAERSHDYADALSHAQELLALEPLSEATHRRVIRGHYLSGDRAAALLAFDRCEQMLKDEIGAAPSPETLALLATIEQAGAPLAVGSDAESARWRPVPASVLRPPRLIGRDAAWQALHQAFATGHGAVVTGEGGMGKSRLLTDFVQGRCSTLFVSARPGDAGVLYASFARLLRALPRDAVSALDVSLHKELARLLPELGDAPALRGEADRARFFNAVQATLESPVIPIAGIVFDDLHFADDASLDLLRYVAAGSSRCWVFALRLAEMSEGGRALLDGFMASPDAVRVTLEPLTLPHVEELLDSLQVESLRGHAHASALLRHTGGNPLYLLETVKAWLAQEPNSPPGRLPATVNISHLIERRIGRLSAPAVQLARCAAIAAPDFSIELASRVLGLRTLDLADPWAELEAAHVLRDGAFAHDLIYEAAVASVPQPVARQLHAEIAAFLQERGGEPARLAQHWVQARQWWPAAAAYRAAADHARDASRLAEQAALLTEAARCYQLAGRPIERFDALLQRARTLASNNLGFDASAAVAALDEAASTDEQRLFALDARLELAMTRYEIDAALRLGRQALAGARAMGRPDLELRFAIILSGAMCDAREAGDAVALLEPYAPWVRLQADVDQQWEYWEATALALDYADRLRDAMPAWDEARAVAQRASRQDMLWKTMSNAASTQAKMGLVREAAAAGARARQLALEFTGALNMRVLQMQVTVAHRLRDLGRYGEALTMLEQSLEVFESAGGSQGDKALTEQRLVVLFQQLGQPGRAVPLLAQERPDLPPGLAMIRMAHRAELEQQMGRDGLPLMREALQIVPNPNDVYHRITSLFATRLLPADEGEALAASLAAWATARERHGVALSGHVRAAACALMLFAPARAWPHVETALHLAKRYVPDSFYLPEMWLVSARTLHALGREADARSVIADALAWVMPTHDHHVPAEFSDSFLHRNPVNRDLLALAAGSGVSPR